MCRNMVNGILCEFHFLRVLTERLKKHIFNILSLCFLLIFWILFLNILIIHLAVLHKIIFNKTLCGLRLILLSGALLTWYLLIQKKFGQEDSMLHLILLHAFTQVLIIFNLLEKHHCYFIQLLFQISVFILCLYQLIFYVQRFNLFLDSTLLSWLPVLYQSFQFFVLVFLFVTVRFFSMPGIILNWFFKITISFRASLA
jgi:hypothetical protein